MASGLWAKFVGLMGRPSLAAGEGLWLPESNGIHMMFMRFPIDVLFLGRAVAGGAGAGAGGAGGAGVVGARAEGAGAGPGAVGARPVIALRRSLPAWTGLVPLVRGAHGVLELPAGTLDPTGTEVGDMILLEDLPTG